MLAPKVAKPQTTAAQRSASKLPSRSSPLPGRRLGNDRLEDALFLPAPIGDRTTSQRLHHRASKPAGSIPGADRDQDVTIDTTNSHETSDGASWGFSGLPCFEPERARRAQPLSLHSAQPGIVQPRLEIGPCSGGDRTLRIWDPATGELARTLKGTSGSGACRGIVDLWRRLGPRACCSDALVEAGPRGSHVGRLD